MKRQAPRALFAAFVLAALGAAAARIDPVDLPIRSDTVEIIEGFAPACLRAPLARLKLRLVLRELRDMPGEDLPGT